MTGMDVSGTKAGVELYKVRNQRPEQPSTSEARAHAEQSLTVAALQRRADAGDQEAIEELDRLARRLQDGGAQ